MEYRFTKPCEKVACFDLDHTLLKPSSGKKFPIDRDDAMLLYPQVKKKLLALMDDGHKIVIFTNQKGIGRYLKATDIYYKVDKYLPKGKEYDVYMSYKSDMYRKPMPGMLDAFMEDNGAITDIFYVGDAAGRSDDFSASDIKFAHNCGITFYTPEEYFLGEAQKVPPIRLLDPPIPKDVDLNLSEKTVILLVGPPGCGKTEFVEDLKKCYKGLVVISNDITGSAAKSLKLFKSMLTTKTIVIDNTNATIANRSIYISVAKQANYEIVAVTFAVDRDIATHLNYYRAYTTDRLLVPNVAYATFYKRYQPVSPAEVDKCLEYVPKYPRNLFEYSFI